MNAFGKRLSWILTGVAKRGTCPECHSPTATVYPDRWACESCEAGGRLPEVHDW